jgi:putative oxidoreductase
MLTILDRLESRDLASLILRLTGGGLILFHGVPKLLGLPDSIGWMSGPLAAHHLPSFLAYGVLVGEVVAPVLLILGFYARIGALLVVVNMLFAILLAHMGQLFTLGGQGGWALELQGFYLFTALALVFLGPGKYGINRH